MKKINIPDTDLSLSMIGLGTVGAGLDWDNEDADRVFDAYVDNGGNVIDTARVYSDWVRPEIGRSERVVGDWLNRSKKRDKVIIITKGGHPDMLAEPVDMHKSRVARSQMEYDINLSLKTLRTDYIDIYFYHRDNTSIPVSELIETMENFRREGKIRYYGCSNWTTARILEADEYCRQHNYRGFVANQALLNIGMKYMNPMDDDTLVSIDGVMYEYHKENGRNLAMPYMGVCSGFFHMYLTGGQDKVKNSPYNTEKNRKIAEHLKELMKKYNATITQVLLGYFTALHFNCLPLYGPLNPDQIIEALKTADINFTKDDYKFLYEI